MDISTPKTAAQFESSCLWKEGVGHVGQGRCFCPKSYKHSFSFQSPTCITQTQINYTVSFKPHQRATEMSRVGFRPHPAQVWYAILGGNPSGHCPAALYSGEARLGAEADALSSYLCVAPPTSLSPPPLALPSVMALLPTLSSSVSLTVSFKGPRAPQKPEGTLFITPTMLSHLQCLAQGQHTASSTLFCMCVGSLGSWTKGL